MASSQKPIALVVEDEMLQRLFAIDLAEEAGYDVIDVADADTAIGILEARKDIRVVFTDIQMPGAMNGLKLAAMVRDRWPPVQIIVVSGNRIVDTTSLPTGSKFFSKPIDATKVVAELRRMAP